MLKKRFYILIIVFLCFSAGAGLLLFIQTPLGMDVTGAVIGYATGLHVNAGDLTLSPNLPVVVTGLSVADPEGARYCFAGGRIEVGSSASKALLGEIEQIVLKKPSFQIRLGESGKTETDFSFIKKIPPVRSLVVEKGEFKLFFKGNTRTITIKEIDLVVRDFSPSSGGTLTFQGIAEITDPMNKGMNFTGKLSGEVRLTAFFPQPLGSGNIAATMDAGSINGFILKDSLLKMAMNLEKEKIRIFPVNLTIAALLPPEEKGKNTEIKEILCRTGITYDLKQKAFSAEGFSLDIPKIASFKGAGSAKMMGPMPWKAHVEASKIDFSVIYAALGQLFFRNEHNNWSVYGSGSMDTDIEGVLKSEPALSGKAFITLRKGGFTSRDGSKAAQGIEGDTALRFSVPSREQKASVSITSKIASGEYLWGTYYKDLTKETTKLVIKTDFAIDKNDRTRVAGTADIFNTGSYAYSGMITNGTWSMDIQAERVNLNRLAAFFFSDYLAQASPSLKGFETQGVLDMNVTVAGPADSLALRGLVKIDEASLKIPGQDLVATGINTSLPFNLSVIDGKKNVSGYDGKKQGFVEINALRKGSIEFSRLRIPLVADGNMVQIPEPVGLPLYGGLLRIMNTAVNDVLSPGRKASLTMKIENIDLGALLNDLTGINLPGNIEAHFPLISYQNGVLSTEGAASLKVFGGDIKGERFFVKKPFLSSRVIGGDVLFQDIDLGEITDALKVGRITGVVNGFLKGLEIEYGQPSKFIFEVKTVEKNGVPRRVSVDAIENISILGTGSGGIGNILKSGINRFFKDYPYSRIGVRCNLENDQFTIRGTIHEGGNEYLIRRAFLRGIDVVNKDPENVVGFKDMQERIGRVFEGAKKGESPTVTVN